MVKRIYLVIVQGAVVEDGQVIGIEGKTHLTSADCEETALGAGVLEFTRAYPGVPIHVCGAKDVTDGVLAAADAFRQQEREASETTDAAEVTTGE